MKTFIASLALPLLAAAAPTTQATNYTNPPFGVMAVRSASPIHYLQLNAAGQKFWLGGKTSSYCPTEVVQDCPAGNKTILAPGGNALVRDTAYITFVSTQTSIGTIHLLNELILTTTITGC
jgi:hypothetical protein